MSVGHTTEILNNADSSVALRVEWCKSRARAQRWREEVCLLLEEMRCILQFLKWKEGVWKAQGGFLESDQDVAERTTNTLLGSRLLLQRRTEGVWAYAQHQASIQQELRTHFQSLWQPVPTLVISQIGRDKSTTFTLDSNLVKDLSQAASFLVVK